MKRYRYIYLLLTFVLAFLITLLVYYFGDIPNRHNNGFKRNYIPHAWSTAHEIKLGDTLYEIAGATPWNIYITVATEGEVLEVGRDQPNKIRRITIPFFRKFYDSLRLSSLSIKIDSPHVYLFAENKPAIIKTALDSSIFDVRILPPGPFTREAIADTDCVILRKMDPAITDQLFVRYSFGTGQLKKEKNISIIYGDGGILTDGLLHFDEATKKLYYIYFYRNLLLSFDTSLTAVHTFSSIDTTRSFKMKTGMVSNDGTAAYTNISPADMINKVSAVKGGRLFNMSCLRADNDSPSFFSDHSILDITDLRNGRYLGSIPLPVIEGHKLSRLIISGNQLIALYPHNIQILDLHLTNDLAQ